MRKKMSLMGVGGKIALVLILYLILAVTLDIVYAPFFKITPQYSGTLLIIGIIIAVFGFSLNLIAAFCMLKAYKNNSLATGGLYRVFRDPMYVFQIFITMPGIFLILNSWLILSAVIPAYIAYKVFVREEHAYLMDKFGKAYQEYQNKIIVKFI